MLIFKELRADTTLPEHNELEAVKFAIMRSLSSLSHGKGGKYINIKTMSLDMPLSPHTFKTCFPIHDSALDGFKDKFSVDDLSAVFGKNWHIYHFANLVTRKRIIGLVLLHFRRKKIHANRSTNDKRYSNFKDSNWFLVSWTFNMTHLKTNLFFPYFSGST